MNISKLSKHTKKRTGRRGGLIVTSSEADRLRIHDVTLKQLADEAGRQQVTTRDQATTQHATPQP